VSGVHQVHALLSLQRKAMVNAFREHASRSGLGVSILISTLWYGLWLSLAGICWVTPHYIGVADIEEALPGLLLFAMGYWQLSPIVTLSLGVSIDMRKLTYYPVPTPTLFVVECLLRIWTGLEIIVVLCGLFLGLITAGTAHPGLTAAALILFVTLNVFLSAGMRNLIERIFRKRLLREAVLVLLVTATVLPQMIFYSAEFRSVAQSAVRNQVEIPLWLSPPGLTAAVGQGQATPADVLVFLAMILGSALFGYLLFAGTNRLAASESAADQAPRPAAQGLVDKILGPLTALMLRVLPDPVGALAEKEIKYLWRSPRFRTPFFMGFTFAVIAWAPIVHQVKPPYGEWMRASAPSMISMYAFLLLGPVLFLNRFGFDRAASRFYFWMPLEMNQLLLSKNLATVFFCYCELLLISAICAVIGMEVTARSVIEAVCVGAIALLWLMAVGNQMSVREPVPSNPDRVSHSSAGNGLRGVVQFFAFPLSLSPVFAALIYRFLGGGDLGYIGILGGAAGSGVVAYYLSFLDASAYGLTNREAIVARLSSGQGPLAAE
jgi:hypothetical protein